MGKIIVLDELTSNQIAAGEVVEGPASIVKEMVENAVDAGATQVQVEIRNGGIRYIRVTDNGGGMERDDVELAFERHATSKIRKIDDLDTLHSMGFRGEALASIASVSRMEMITRTAAEPVGTRVTLEGGQILSVEPSGGPVGTTFLVRDLFFNTPARYKFLKKDVTEASRVADVMERMALAHPDVSLQLTTNGGNVMRTPGNGDLASVIYALYGRETAEALLPLSGEFEGIRVAGYVGRPAIARGNRARQTFLMNGRVIRSGSLNAALDEGFRTLLMTRQFAFAVVCLEVPPNRVDVNVHPSKLEVRFSEERAVYGALHGAVKNALMTGAAAGTLMPQETLAPKGIAHPPSAGYAVEKAAAPVSAPISVPEVVLAVAPNPRPVSIPEVMPVGAPNPQPVSTSDVMPAAARVPDSVAISVGMPTAVSVAGAAESSAESLPDSAEETLALEPVKPTMETAVDILAGAPAEPVAEMAEDILAAEPEALLPVQQRFVPEAPSLPDPMGLPHETDDKDTSVDEPQVRHPVFLHMRIVGQVFDSFLVLEHGEEMLLLDQHAAHERIRFEDLRDGLRRGDVPSQPFLAPVLLHLTASEYGEARPALDRLRQLGFDMEAFGGNTVVVRAVPSTFDGGLSDAELTAIVMEGAADTGNRQGAVSEETLHRISCKGAIKANRNLSDLEIRALLNRLSDLENPYTCVHGRPILLRFSRRELEKRFKRIV